MARSKILEENEVLAASIEPEILAGAEQNNLTDTETTSGATTTPTTSGDNPSSTEENIGGRPKSEFLRLRLLGYI